MFSETTSASDHELNSIFHLLDELDRHLFHRRRRLHTYVPRFDLEEFSNSYVLMGEVPGLQRDDLSVIATDNHSLEVHGKTQRTEVRESNKEPDEKLAVSKDVDILKKVKDSKTIESVDQHGTNCDVGSSDENPRTVDASTVEKQREDKKLATEESPKRLISERVLGEFHRSFSFAKPIITSGVTATVHDGVLKVVVPKGPAPKEKAVPVTYMGNIGYAGW